MQRFPSGSYLFKQIRKADLQKFIWCVYFLSNLKEEGAAGGGGQNSHAFYLERTVEGERPMGSD